MLPSDLAQIFDVDAGVLKAVLPVQPMGYQSIFINPVQDFIGVLLRSRRENYQLIMLRHLVQKLIESRPLTHKILAIYLKVMRCRVGEFTVHHSLVHVQHECFLSRIFLVLLGQVRNGDRFLLHLLLLIRKLTA